MTHYVYKYVQWFWTSSDLTRRQLTSENYQIMNYGLGGSILNHRDADDSGRDDPIYSESWWVLSLVNASHIMSSHWPGIMEVPAWPQWWYGSAQWRREGGRCLTGPGSRRSGSSSQFTCTVDKTSSCCRWRGLAPPWSGGTSGAMGAWTAGTITWAAPWSGETSGLQTRWAGWDLNNCSRIIICFSGSNGRIRCGPILVHYKKENI